MEMTINDFESGLEKYYGKHQSQHVSKVTMKYVLSNYEENNYSSLMQAIMKSHPFNYGFPDVAAIEEAQDKLWKKENKSLRKKKTSSQWAGDYEPLTDKEREEAAKEHEKFLEFAKRIVNDKSITEDKKYCKDCTFFSKSTDTYECRGCLNRNKYQEII